MEEVKSLLSKVPRNKKTYAIGTIIILLIIARLALPYVIKKYLNDYLANDIKNYTGHVEDVDLALWRGAYQIDKFNLMKKVSRKRIPFIKIDTIDISISWRALFRGRFLVDLILSEPEVNFVDSRKADNKQLGADENWKDVMNKVVPFNLENFIITRGEVHFLNNETKVPIDLFFKNIELNAQNIHNSKKQDSALFSKYEMTATPQAHGELYSKGSFNVLVEPPDFDINLKLEKLNLTKLNAFLKVYGPIDLTSGEFDFFMELACRQGQLKGYIKPVFKKMDVRDGRGEVDKTFKETTYEVITALVNVILQNRDTDLLAAKIPIEGSLKDPKLNVWKGVKSAFANRIGNPEIKLKIDNKINLKSVKPK